ncbi:MAG: dTMP kinase [Burkholderiaceae bacterium]|nr:MAG: dTMP kinase [Burkholderiaceae bacterium]
MSINTSPRGKFITFEGIDGAGKSTHIAAFADALRARGHVVTLTREPGGTPLGESLRDLLLHTRTAMHPETEALLMFAARREHIAQVIEPALTRGEMVISDRFSDASFAYQSGGRGVPVEKLEQLEQWTHPQLQPDLTLLFDLPPDTAEQRRQGARDADRFEAEQQDFFARVRAAYLDRARKHAQRIHVIDAHQSIEQIRAELEALVATVADSA